MDKVFFANCRYHRNGVGGAGYFALQLGWSCDSVRYTGNAIVFEMHGAPSLDGCISIIDQNGDSWRYEDFATEIRAFINSNAGQQMAFPHVAGEYR